jgi:uncharacterized membrane protein YqjE
MAQPLPLVILIVLMDSTFSLFQLTVLSVVLLSDDVSLLSMQHKPCHVQVVAHIFSFWFLFLSTHMMAVFMFLY